MSLLVPALLLLLTIPLVVGIMRINELFVVAFRDNSLRMVRGKCPAALFNELADVLGRSRVAELRLRAVVEDGRARLYAEPPEVPAGVRQQLRNVVGAWPVAKIRTAKAKR